MNTKQAVIVAYVHVHGWFLAAFRVLSPQTSLLVVLLLFAWSKPPFSLWLNTNYSTGTIIQYPPWKLFDQGKIKTNPHWRVKWTRSWSFYSVNDYARSWLSCRMLSKMARLTESKLRKPAEWVILAWLASLRELPAWKRSSHVLLNSGSISPSKFVFILKVLFLTHLKNYLVPLLYSLIFFGRKGCINQLFTWRRISAIFSMGQCTFKLTLESKLALLAFSTISELL